MALCQALYLVCALWHVSKANSSRLLIRKSMTTQDPTSAPTPAPTSAICTHDDDARRRSGSIASVCSSEFCQVALSSRRRALGGEAFATCQNTCHVEIGCLACNEAALTSQACSQCAGSYVWAGGSCQTTCDGYNCPSRWFPKENQADIVGQGRYDQACCQEWDDIKEAHDCFEANPEKESILWTAVGSGRLWLQFWDPKYNWVPKVWSLITKSSSRACPTMLRVCDIDARGMPTVGLCKNPTWYVLISVKSKLGSEYGFDDWSCLKVKNAAGYVRDGQSWVHAQFHGSVEPRICFSGTDAKAERDFWLGKMPTYD